MSSSTWTQIAAGSGIVTALGGGLSAIGQATGSEFLQDLGPIAAAIGGVGIAVGSAGAFATASQQQQSAALVSAGPIVTALTAGNIQQQSAAQAQAHAIASGVPTTTRTEAATAGVGDALGSLIALPFKLIKKLLEAVTG